MKLIETQYEITHQPEKSLLSNRAWSYSSPLTNLPPKYRPFNESLARSASKKKKLYNRSLIYTIL